jgi:hypothetical protein
MILILGVFGSIELILMLNSHRRHLTSDDKIFDSILMTYRTPRLMFASRNPKI